MRLKYLMVLSFLLLQSALALGGSTTVVFLHANVIPMDRERILNDQTVLVSDGRIVSVGDAVKGIPADAMRIDARGKYLIPGLTDMHVHINEPEDMMLWLDHGITTVLNLNGSTTHLRWRDSIRAGAMEGPTLYTSCPTIFVANTAREGDSLARAYHAAGYDCLKIYNDVSLEAYNAIIAAAKEKGMLTVGHIARAPGFEGALKAGMAIAHAEEYIYTVFHDTTDYSCIREVVRMTRDANIPVIATLTTYAHITAQVRNLDSMLAQDGLRYIPAWIREDWSPERNRYSSRRGFKVARLEQRLSFQDSLVAALHRAGVPILAGTDAVFNAMVSGSATLQEIERFVAIGFSPYDALKSATTDAAAFLRAGHEFGTIEPGSRADLVLLDGNPLADIKALEHRAGVMARGRWYPSAELQAKLDRLPETFDAAEPAFRNNLQHNLDAAIRYERDREPFCNLLFRALNAEADGHHGAEFSRILRAFHAADPTIHAAWETVINDFGYRMMSRKLYDEAIAVLTLNTELYPGSANTFDSLGEAYFNAGEKDKSRDSYRRALALDPGLESSRKMLEKLR